jgi:hypothetical protein
MELGKQGFMDARSFTADIRRKMARGISTLWKTGKICIFRP